MRSSSGANTAPNLGGAQTYASTVSSLTGSEKSASLAAQPAFVVEDVGRATQNGAGQMAGAIVPQGGVGDPEDLHLYRITARSNGGSNTVMRVTESTYLALLPKSFSAN
jgi:type IV pilus assembly protein PilX